MVNRMTKWRKANPEKARLAERRDRGRLSQGRKQQIKDYRRRREQELRRQVLELLGDKCAACGFSDIRALEIDHIDGGGYRAKLHVSVLRRYKNILEARGEGRQLLCANCNQIKKHVNKENRH